jgi:hypothetical protein
MDLKFWKKESSPVREDYKIVKKVKKGGKKLDKQQKKLVKMQERQQKP